MPINVTKTHEMNTKSKVSSFLLDHPFLFYIKKYKGYFSLGIVALVFTNAFDIAGPYIIGEVIDELSEMNTDRLYQNLFLLLCVSAGTAIFRYLWRIFFGNFHHSVAADLRGRLFKKMLFLDHRFHQKIPTGEKMTLITQDIDNFRMGIGPGLLIFFDALIYIVGLLPLMLLINVSWTLKCLALMPLIPFVIFKLENKLNLRYRKLQDETGELTSFAQETVSGVKVIKSLGLNKLRSHLFQNTNTKLRDYGIDVDKIESAFGPSLEFFVMIGTATLLFVGADEVVSGKVSVGHFFAFYQYLLRMIWPMTALGFSFMMHQEAKSSFSRIKKTMDQDHPEEGTLTAELNQNLEIVHLKFKYDDEHTVAQISDINFVLKPSESMAIVGAVGSGKSTLVNLISGSMIPTEGQVLYGDVPVQNFTKHSLRKIVSLVPQKIFLFKKSIYKNLTDFLSKEDHARDIQSVLKSSHIDHEIENLPDKIHTELEENGQGLSGGQRQRLTLARGLTFTSQWLILDDTLSAVDIETEHKILSQLKSMSEGNSNFIFCSHRIQSISWVDKILVLDKGKQIDLGTHEELYQRCAIYRDLYTSNKSEKKIKRENPVDENLRST